MFKLNKTNETKEALKAELKRLSNLIAEQEQVKRICEMSGDLEKGHKANMITKRARLDFVKVSNKYKKVWMTI